MSTKFETFIKPHLKTDLLDIRPGDTIRVYQKISASLFLQKGKKKQEADKEKIQAFEGIVIARKHGKGISATITVRKIISGIGVEKIFPLHSPNIKKIEILKKGKVRRAKLYYLRGISAKQISRIKTRTGKKEEIKLKEKEITKPVSEKNQKKK